MPPQWSGGIVRMETLYSLAVIVGLMKSYAVPPKVVTAPVVQQSRVAEVVAKPRAPVKKGDSEWPLDY
jgi:hypothetical protein